MFLLSALAHHGEPGDPVLLEWINEQVYAILGLEDSAMVIVFGAIILGIPIGVLAFFAIQRVRSLR